MGRKLELGLIALNIMGGGNFFLIFMKFEVDSFSKKSHASTRKRINLKISLSHYRICGSLNGGDNEKSASQETTTKNRKRKRSQHAAGDATVPFRRRGLLFVPFVC